ncbi:MAG: hypothetical protein JJU36_03025 [Phycisphaeraceae bacterium]|nr:hypothetical protein [Phycisphaeraceae bacterium]
MGEFDDDMGDEGDLLTLNGFEAPTLTQLSCFLANRVGKLLELVGVFEGQYLEVAALTVLEASDHAVVRLITSRAELARRLLRRNNIPFSEAEVLAVEIPSGKSFSDICKALLSAEVSIEYSYPLLSRPRGRPVMVVHTDDQILAGQLLRRKLFTLVCENDLGENATGSDPADCGA